MLKLRTIHQLLRIQGMPANEQNPCKLVCRLVHDRNLNIAFSKASLDRLVGRADHTTKREEAGSFDGKLKREGNYCDRVTPIGCKHSEASADADADAALIWSQHSYDDNRLQTFNRGDEVSDC